MAGKDTNIGAKRARETRAQLGVADGAPPGCLLTRVEEDLAMAVVVARLPAAVAGCCWRDGERVVLWVNGLQAVVRQRFTLAHELGHVRCGHDARVAVDTYETLSGQSTDAREVQANAFAAELLAPAHGVRAIVGDRQPGLDEVVTIAARFGISTLAALYRLQSLRMTARYATLKREIEAGLHEHVRAHLSLPAVDDELAAIERLPRLSPVLRGSALAAMIDGSVSGPAAAQAAGCEPLALAAAAATIGVA